MTTYRLSKVVEVIHYWPFFSEGFKYASRYLKTDVDIEVFRKMLLRVVVDPTAWVGMVVVSNKPVGYAVAVDCTPLFSTRKEYDVSLVYHQTGNDLATKALRDRFEGFCKDENISAYYFSTRRFARSAAECLETQYGLKRAYLVYKKQLN